MYRVFGFPDEESWPNVTEFELYRKMKKRFDRGVPAKGLKAVFEELRKFQDPVALDLLNKMMTLCPEKRISAVEALSHPWFTASVPRPCDPCALPRLEGEISQQKTNKIL